jgi:HlyD family secretion protein
MQPAVLRDFQPKPGMPAEVYIKTSERTFFQYLMQPVKDSMSRAFRES